jgi:hypothetical protein
LRDGLEGSFCIFGEWEGDVRMQNVPESDGEGVRYGKNQESTMSNNIFIC